MKKSRKNFLILGIETSCDETAISVLKFDRKGNFKILANVVSSQVKVHAPFGGVVPSLAKREHQKNLIPVLKWALKETKLLRKIPISKSPPALTCTSPKASARRELQRAGKIPAPMGRGSPNYIGRQNSKIKTIKQILEREDVLAGKTLNFFKKYQKPKIDLIAVTYGPGLAPALWPGVNLARALSYYWQIPIADINHLEAHLFSSFLENKKISGFRFPTIALIVSGGHTQLILMKNWGNYKLIGETRDDAAGECFDKSARLLGLGYPGGPAIAAEAAKIKNQKSKIKNQPEIKLPRPMINSQDFDFSFSGLKTAVLYLVEKLKKEKKNIKNLIPALANEIQNSINEVLIAKTIKAAKKYKVKSVILGGGVAANASLRDRLAKTIKNELPDVSYFCPERKFSTDNAAMIALTAYFNRRKTKKKNKFDWENLEAGANLRLKEIK